MEKAIDPYLVSAAKAASYLGVSESYLAKKRMNGSSKLPYVKIGAAVRYRLPDLKSYADNCLRKSTVEV